MSKGFLDHPMVVVTRRTGLRADVIRAWERRHRAVQPRRGSGSRRLYTDEEIRRLDLIRRTVESGWQIGQVAHLSNADLREYLSASRLRPPRLPGSVR
jgi:DNA-binding transcriptional MerR regulator